MGKLNCSGKGTSVGGKWWHGKEFKYRNKKHRQFRDGIPRLIYTRRQRAKPLHFGWAVGAALIFVAYLAAAAHFN